MQKRKEGVLSFVSNKANNSICKGTGVATMKDSGLLFYKALFEHTTNAVSYQKMLFDQNGAPCDYELISINQSFRALFRLDEASIEQKKMPASWPFQAELKKQRLSAIFDAIAGKKAVTFDLESSSAEKWLRVTAFPVADITFGLVYVDITNEIAVKTDMELFLTVSPDMLCVTTQDARFIKVNAVFEQILGYSVAELENQNFITLVHEEDQAEILSILKSQTMQSDIQTFVARCRCKSGDYKSLEWRWKPVNGCFYSAARDITEKITLERQLRAVNEDLVLVTKTLRHSNQQLQRLAGVDQLTGAYNRYFFDRRVTDSIGQAETQKQSLSLILFDLDHFKNVNDQWGHPVGDEVLKKTVQTAAGLIRDSDTLNRIGGEEFAILMPKTSLAGARLAAEKVRAGLEQVSHLAAGKVTASFGVAEHAAGETFLNWYRRADLALYRAKNSGRNCVVVSSAQDAALLAPVCLEWRDEWACGDSDIDEQHRTLLALGNQLLQNAFSETPTAKTDILLENLQSALARHFKTEETKLSDIAYSAYKQHRAIHAKLLVKINNFSRSPLMEKEQAAAFFSFLVNDIVLGHMLKDDIRFFDAIKQARQASRA